MEYGTCNDATVALHTAPGANLNPGPMDYRFGRWSSEENALCLAARHKPGDTSYGNMTLDHWLVN